MSECEVRFLSHRKTVRVKRGTDVLNAALQCGIVLSAACGGDGLCGKCRVIVRKGAVKSDLTHLIAERDKKRGVVLACQSIIEGDAEIDIPPESLEVHEGAGRASEEFARGAVLAREARFPFSPLVRKIYCELSRPTAADATGDVDRVAYALRSVLAGQSLVVRPVTLKHIGALLRENDFKATAVIGRRDGSYELLALEPGDTSGASFGFAFDIGTTTVAGQLVDLATGTVIGSRIAFNKQARYGSDVITRIVYASEPAGLERLNALVIENINEIIDDLTAATGIARAQIYAISIAGNMTMMHLLLRIDPENIRKEPYVPATTAFTPLHPGELAIGANPRGLVQFAPGVSTYVGGDIVAGVLACGLYEETETVLLVDIGTNGEIVIGNREWMIGAAASAGPAFEGSGLACGMKAVTGAIQKVTIGSGDDDIRFETIGAAKPTGICGSGYIDLLCQLLKAGIIGKDGRIDRERRSRRIRRTGSQYEFIIAFATESGTGSDLVIQEDDIENLKRSKGAIVSAIYALLAKVEMTAADLGKIYIAGGFGTYLNIENAIRIGLLPDTDRARYVFIGNSSLAGSRMALLADGARRAMDDIASRITYIDLGSDPRYMDEYVASLFFPHTDAGRFPSVRS